MRTVVIYPGRFHPFHRGHKASYDHLVKQFGEGNVYVVSSNKQAPLTSPFSFDDKMTMMTKLGIASGRIAQVVNPYQAREITQEIDNPENTVLIFAVSEKDMTGPDARFKFGVKRDGTPSYMQPYPADGKKLQNMTKHAYVLVTPTVNFRVRGADANSASEIRKQYIEGNDADREQIIADLYGEMDQQLKDMFDRNLGVAQQVRNIVKEARIQNPQRALTLLETIKRLEKQANPDPDDEDLMEFLPALGAAVGRALVGAEAGTLARAAGGLAGHAIGSEIEDTLDLEEFKSNDRDDDDNPVPEYLMKLANRWWNSAGYQPQIESVLNSMGWSIQQVESEDDAVQLQHQDGTVYFISADEFDPDYIEEKWSQKYKRSINCNRPRGFSQRAHCAGRKK